MRRALHRTFLLAVLAAGVVAAPTAAAAHPTALVLSGHAANNTVAVRATGVDSGTYSVNGGPSHRFAGITSLTIQGHGGHDICRIVNPPHSLFAPRDGIWCNGGNRAGQPRRGVLTVERGQAATSSYGPGAVPGTGVIVHWLGPTRQVIHFTGLAPVTDTTAAIMFTFTDPIANDELGVISANVGSGTWTLESLSHPGAYETYTFDNKATVTLNATLGGDSVTLTPLGPDTGMTQLDVNATGSIAVVGADLGAATSAALNSGDTIIGAGSSPQLVAGGVAAVAPNGIGPLTGTITGFAATSANGSIELHDTGSLALGSAGGLLSQNGISAHQNAIISSGGNLVNHGPVTGASVALGASTADLSPGTVTSPAVTLAPVSAGGAVTLGGTAAAGALGLSQASLSTIQTSALTIGGPTTGAMTVAGPLNLSVPVAFQSTGGFGASGAGAITGGSLTFTDEGAVGRPWTIGPSALADGVGSPVLYTASSLAVNGGSGNDSFDVSPSGATAMRLDGGAPTGGTSGDSLTFEAGGEAVTGAAQPPLGDLVATGHQDVIYGSMEQVRVVNPFAAIVSTPVAAPVCSLVTQTSAVAIGRGNKPHAAPFALLAACSQTAQASIVGTLSVTPVARRGKPKTTRITLKAGPVALTAGTIRGITVAIPTAALVALRAGARESLTLTLTATAGAQTGQATVTVKKLAR